jgi:hypothetical protein
MSQPGSLVAVVAASAAALASITAFGASLIVAGMGAVLYVDSHGIHLAANSIGHEALAGRRLM